ncbi:MAG: prefoldin subunit [Candidatus Pacearchaeota archaeon]|jgi:prefoldin beta subunit
MTDKDRERNIEELQIAEQNMQNLFLQKQAFQIELRETQAALKELEKSGDEVYKIIGQMMIKTDKKEMKEELSRKEKIIDIKIKSFERQEAAFSEKINELQRQITK